MLGCKKDKDTQAPVVKIISPNENQNFMVGDTIQLNFEITDDTKIESVNISIIDENQIPILPNFLLLNISNGSKLNQPIPIDNTAIASGNYFISIRVSDGKNEQTYFRKIYINELPLKRKAVFFISENSGQFQVNKIDSAFAIQFAYPLSGDFIGSAIDSKNKLLVTAGEFTGKLQSANTQGYSVNWSESPITSSTPYYRNISRGNDLNFVSYATGFIKGFDFTGAIKYTSTSDQGVYIPLKTGVSSKYILNEQTKVVGIGKKLVLYYYPSGIDKQEVNFTGDVVAIYPKKEDEFFVFYNVASIGKISIYSVSSNSITYTYSSPSLNRIISSLALSGNNFLVGTDNGIYSFQYNPTNFIPFISSIKADKIKYDEANNEIIIAAKNKMYFYDYASVLLQNTVTTADSICDLQVLYNR